MWLPTLLLLGLAAGGGAPSVVLLPFDGDEDTNQRERRRLNSWLRAAVDAVDTEVKLLPKTKRDEKDARRCGWDEKCLSDLAYARGADALAVGRWKQASGTSSVEILVVQAAHEVPGQRFDMAFSLDRKEEKWIAERIWRKAFLPNTLRGTLWVSGAPDGAMVEVDGVFAGLLPLQDANSSLKEGTHIVTVRKEGYLPVEKRVEIEYARRNDIRIVLTPVPSSDWRDAHNGSQMLSGEKPWPSWAPWALAGVGGGMILAGIATGLATVSLQKEVEERAAQQLLYFPRDEKLIQTGQAYAWGTNVLWTSGLLAAVGAGVWWGWMHSAERNELEGQP